MLRLNDRAWNLLHTEIERITQNDEIAGEVQRNIALKRLNKLRKQTGKPATAAELHSCLDDLFPSFDPNIIAKAVKLNRPPGKLKRTLLGVGIGAGTLAGLAGIIWFVNLPYPMIRRPMARTAPLLLFPSYLSMDHNYRGAISNVEQADQLVRNATSPADIELGAQKVQEAQNNLDALPIWFLGYEPGMYCTFTRCVWYFTFDEYRQARAQVGRMEAIVFQEENALAQFDQAEANLIAAKEQFTQSTTTREQQQATGAWQAALDQLQQLPPQTLAGLTAQTKLVAYQRDFQGLVGTIAGSNRTLTMIEAAKQFGAQAAQSALKPPHSVAKWQTTEELWQEATGRLQKVPDDGVDYLEAQKLLATYETNLREIRLRKQAEQEAVQILDQVQQQVQQLQQNANRWEKERVISELEGIRYELNKIQPGTTVYNQAQELLQFATQKRNQLG
jgi:hypothetical protein